MANNKLHKLFLTHSVLNFIAWLFYYLFFCFGFFLLKKFIFQLKAKQIIKYNETSS